MTSPLATAAAAVGRRGGAQRAPHRSRTIQGGGVIVGRFPDTASTKFRQDARRRRAYTDGRSILGRTGVRRWVEEGTDEWDRCFRWAIAFARSANMVIFLNTAAEPLSESLRLRTALMCSLIAIQGIGSSPTVISRSSSGRSRRHRHRRSTTPARHNAPGLLQGRIFAQVVWPEFRRSTDRQPGPQWLHYTYPLFHHPCIARKAVWCTYETAYQTGYRLRTIRPYSRHTGVATV